jgi:subtilisin family serine protease
VGSKNQLTYYSNYGPRIPDDQCYAIVQGTSIATPHASAVLALIVSAHPTLRHRPNGLIAALKSSARPITGNTTQPVSATDTSPVDLTGMSRRAGTAISAAPPVSDTDAYGAGLVDAGHGVR